MNDPFAGLQPEIEAAPNVRVLLNVGCGLDVPTGIYLECRHGEYALNGGMAVMQGYTAIGNAFKSTTAEDLIMIAMSHFEHSRGLTYDTECNKHEWHLGNRAMRIIGEDVFANRRWTITDKSTHTGEAFYEKLKEYLQNKLKNAKQFTVATPFWNRDRTAPFMMLYPTFTLWDSFSEFETSDVIAMQNKAELGESEGNTIFMRQGLAKKRILSEAPRLYPTSYNYTCMIAQQGKETTMQNAGPGGQQPIKSLGTMKHGDKMKGVTNTFTFLMQQIWQFSDTKPLVAQDGFGPMYPRDTDDKNKYETDLNLVTARQLRSKSGKSGMPVYLIVSQEDGLLPSLTEFYNLREVYKGFGFEGNNVTYSVVFLPNISLRRTTIRSLVEGDGAVYVLRRALNILMELAQLDEFHKKIGDDLICSPKDLRDDLIKLGYDWDVLLLTRGWWTVNNEQHPIPFLSTMDLLRMRKGLYHPYWMTEDKKLKPEYKERLLANMNKYWPDSFTQQIIANKITPM